VAHGEWSEIKLREELEFHVSHGILRYPNVPSEPWAEGRIHPKEDHLLRRIDHCETLKIRRSTLIGNDEWKALGESAK